MKTYTCPETKEQFLADAHENLRLFEIGKTDPVLDLPIPPDLVGQVQCAMRRPEAETVIQLAKQCIDADVAAKHGKAA